ncbi:MAG: hypothetical protein U9N85_03035 [Bacteroidota bacterium]|nr:hypothetical protein [Bacteroidota bacterium]
MENIKEPIIKVFVFGTLRKEGRLNYYMEGTDYRGLYYTEGQLMKSEIGSAYIDFTYKNVATFGELHYINYPCLQRIDHLESRSGEFPKGYDLDLIPIWKYKKGQEFSYEEKDKEYAFFYSRRNNPLKIISGDWMNRTKPVTEISDYLKRVDQKISAEDLIRYMEEYLDK